MQTEAGTIVSSYESTTTRLARQELGPCTLIEDLLPLYIEGEVSPSSRDLIVEHLARCERCAGFLAGAQSVRVQLKRETNQRVSTAVNSQPEQRVVAKGQWMLMSLAILFCCGVGGAGSAAVWVGIDHGSPLPLFGGVLLTIMSFGLFLALARSRSPLTVTRVLALMGSCGAGALCTFLMIMPHNSMAVLVGMLFGILGVAGAWLSIWQGGVHPDAGTGELKVQGLPLAIGVVLVGLAFAFLGMMSIHSLFLSSPVALVLVGIVLVLVGQRRRGMQ